MLEEKLPPGNYEDILKDGVILCKLINKLAPGSVKKIQTKGTNFQLMENVQRYIIIQIIFLNLHLSVNNLQLINIIIIFWLDSKRPLKNTVSRKRKSSKQLIFSKSAIFHRLHCAFMLWAG